MMPDETIRERLVRDGKMADQSWADWISELDRLDLAAGGRYGPAGAISECGVDLSGQSVWRTYYDDAYTPADAMAEDGSYD